MRRPRGSARAAAAAASAPEHGRPCRVLAQVARVLPGRREASVCGGRCIASHGRNADMACTGAR